VRVHPAMLPRTHPLAAVRGAFNAVFIEGAAPGELMLYGRGAGGARPRRPFSGTSSTPPTTCGGVSEPVSPPGRGVRIRPDDDLWCAWYLSIDVPTVPGVLAAVAQVFGDHGVSIRSMEQVAWVTRPG
jgi:homoserine dehydrogenase